MQIFSTVRLGMVAAGLALVFISAGCKPSGERALVEGDRLFQAGKVAEAIPVLERAVETLPHDARALNRLGLAYHSAGRADEARRAYLRALEIDRNLFEANHNLALLYQAKGDLLEAERSLRAYLGVQREDGPAWARLGGIQFQAGRLDEAERSFGAAKQFNATGPAEWNQLGLISTQKKRYREARDRFQWVLRLDPSNAPAQLNLAILNHQHLGDRRTALAHYKAWLTVAPAGSDTASVLEIIRQLELQLGLVLPPKPETTNAPVPVRQMVTTTNPPPTVTKPVVAARTNAPNAPPAAAVRSNPPPEVARTVATSQPSPPAAAPTNAVITPAPRKPARPLEIVKIEEDAPLQAARDVPPNVTAPPPVSAPVTESPPADVILKIPNPTPTVVVEDQAKRSFWQKANPASWFRRDPSGPETTTPLETASLGAPVSAAAAAPAARPAPSRPVIPSPQRFERPAPPRYVSRAPAALPNGDRPAAETEFNQAVEAHRRRDLAAAARGYRKATTLDPAYYEAHHNLAIVALDQGDLSLALLACENALLLKPAEIETRRTFAQALRQAGNTADAVEQIETILESKPADGALHLAAAGIYAGDLGDVSRARAHYETLLALEPSHPQAAGIRSWLASNPR